MMLLGVMRQSKRTLHHRAIMHHSNTMRNVICCVAAFFCAFFTWHSASAAPLAEEHTVLYYLIEMERQHGTACANAPKQKLPSLTPSSGLRDIAETMGTTSTDFNAQLAERGLTGAPFFSATVAGSDPKAVLAELRAQQCASIMSPQYTYIGAAKKQGAWFIIMAGKEPAGPVYTPTPMADVAVAEPAPIPREGIVPLPDPNPTPAWTPPVIAEPAPAQIDTIHSAEPTGFAEGDTDPAAPAPPQEVGIVTYTMEPVATVGQPQTAPQPVAVAQPQAVSPSTASNNNSPADALISLINTTRRNGYSCGSQRMQAEPVQKNAIVSAVAERHARDMGMRGYFSSTSPEGERTGKRLSRAGYAWALIAENIANGVNSPNQVLDSWLANEGQCKNIMNKEFTQAGVAWDAPSGTWVLTMVAPASSSGIRLE